MILFPGSNREGDAARALQWATGNAPTIVWHDDRTLPEGTDLVVLPGGFSYGDYLRCGAIAARARIMDAVRSMPSAAGLCLGICNGFQILCEAGLLPGVLVRNAGLRFVCRMQHLRVETNSTRFTHAYAPGQILKAAIAHGEGNYVIDPATTGRDSNARGESRSGTATRQAESGRTQTQTAQRTTSPESTMKDFNVLGLMPHLENLVDPLVGGEDGRQMFAALRRVARMTNSMNFAQHVRLGVYASSYEPIVSSTLIWQALARMS